MKKVLVVGGSQSYYRPFNFCGEYTDDEALLDKTPESISLVVFTGGEDVTPSLYGEEKHPSTYHSVSRDKFEQAVFEKSIKLKKPIVGICRGSQFICAMSGGKLVQNISGHGVNHDLKTDDDRTIRVTSTHHQMQLPPKNAEPIAWAEPRRSTFYEGAPGVNYKPELEYDVVWYPSVNALGMQYHPEYMASNSEGFLYSQELVRRFFDL